MLDVRRRKTVVECVEIAASEAFCDDATEDIAARSRCHIVHSLSDADFVARGFNSASGLTTLIGDPFAYATI
jgi:hypothetical protein